jgi:hypothetical protein
MKSLFGAQDVLELVENEYEDLEHIERERERERERESHQIISYPKKISDLYNHKVVSYWEKT